jgi:REP-associated tyrosine transposase
MPGPDQNKFPVGKISSCIATVESEIMANTYTSLYYHIVFSTKNRVACIRPAFEQRVWKYIGGIVRDNNMTALQVGGVEDHIHALIMAPPTLSPSKIVQLLKGGSSLWIHTEFPEISSFDWEDGYGLFSINKSFVPKVERYIKSQREHHRKMSFQEEYREFLKMHGVDYDERYLLG